MASSSGGVEESRQLLKQLSHQSSSESCVGEELDLLTNVYFDDLQISHTERGPSLSLHITPSTADDKDKQFVYLDLTILLPFKYPQISPLVSLGQSRGLSDAHLRGISEGLSLKCGELLGCPMVYELVEYARECLTDNNLPCSRCAICQVQFQEGDDFTKTDCYHYLHVLCLTRYLDFFERERRESEREAAMMDTMLRKKPKQLECPVCRDPIPPGSVCLDAVAGSQSATAAALHELDDEVNFAPSPELKAWQDRMASLLWKQKQKGGVIDPNSEDDVIDETWVSSVSGKQIDEVMEDKGEGAVFTEKRIDSVNNENREINNDNIVIGEMVQDQRSGSDGRTEKERTSENREAGGRRRREMDKNSHISEKKGNNQTSGTRSKRTYRHYDKRRSGQGTGGRGEEGEVERRREETGHYRGRGNDRIVWREEGESSGHYRGKQRGRDYQRTSDAAGKGYRQETRGERSDRARQGSGGRTYYHKSNAYSAKDQSVPRRQREKKQRDDATPPAPALARTGDAGVRLKIRDTDAQDSHPHKTDGGEPTTQE